MVGAHKFFNNELEVISGPLGRTYHKEEMSKLWDADYIDSLFDFCSRMQKLELSYKEIAILKCIVLMFTGIAINYNVHFNTSPWKGSLCVWGLGGGGRAQGDTTNDHVDYTYKILSYTYGPCGYFNT